MKTLYLSAAALALTATASVAAIDVASMDANKDGLASREEVQAMYPALTDEDFNQIDINHNNYLDVSELTGEAQGLLEKSAPGGAITKADDVAAIMVADTDGDGFISKAEMQARYPGLSDAEFDDIDSNGDGKAEASELYKEASMTVMKQYIPGAANPAVGADTTATGNAVPADPNAVIEVAFLDQDGDGFASREEVMAALPKFDPQQFTEIDQNKDNRLSRDEVLAPDAQVVLRRFR